MTSVRSVARVEAVVSKPHISPELIAYLQELFPDKAPDINANERDIWASVGAVRVVRHLTALYDEQVEHQLGNIKHV